LKDTVFPATKQETTDESGAPCRDDDAAPMAALAGRSLSSLAGRSLAHQPGRVLNSGREKISDPSAPSFGLISHHQQFFTLITNQPLATSQNKSAPAISHQPNEQAAGIPRISDFSCKSIKFAVDRGNEHSAEAQQIGAAEQGSQFTREERIFLFFNPF
jgi:hypothetical protein